MHRQDDAGVIKIRSRPPHHKSRATKESMFVEECVDPHLPVIFDSPWDAPPRTVSITGDVSDLHVLAAIRSDLIDENSRRISHAGTMAPKYTVEGKTGGFLTEH